jgi:hypothetical protein
MDAIADAVVYAVAYLNCRGDEDDDELLDDDDGALGSIAAMLRGAATPPEQDALAAAAERALAEEQASPSPRENFVDAYTNWMEIMFPDDWEGNRRVNA